MKKNQKVLLKLSCLAFTSLLLFLNSCQSDNDNNATVQLKADSHLISQADAILIAENLALKGGTSSTVSKGAKIKKAGDVFARLTNKKAPAFYIINYNSGGFAIVSADDRNTPILAYSDNSTFQNDTTDYPEGLKMWLAFQTKTIEKIKIKGEVQSAARKTEWSTIAKTISGKSITSRITIEPEGPLCPENSLEMVGPLLTTTWGQDYGYNTLVPFLCSSSSSGRAPTGCVATAMAQVMKYYQKPATYNWANMPANYGTSTTAQLMVDIGSAVSMSYSCDGSAASSDQIASSFRDDYHYSDASGTSYNYQTVVSQIIARKPVILTGGRKKSGISFNMYTDGHAWVCDGYRRSSNYSYDESSGNCIGGSILQLHMNWGWSGSYDGWYYFNDFNPADRTYNYDTKMHYNITP